MPFFDLVGMDGDYRHWKPIEPYQLVEVVPATYRPPGPIGSAELENRQKRGEPLPAGCAILVGKKVVGYSSGNCG